MVKRDRGGMARAAMVALALVAGGWQCDDDRPAPELDTLVRFWRFHRLDNGETGPTPIGADRVQVGGTVSEKVAFGGVVLHPPGTADDAEGEVFSNDTGATYWVSAQAPSSALGQGAPIGSTAALTQYQVFRKTAADASLEIVLSKVYLDSIDANGGLPTALECPWHRPLAAYGDCRRTMWAWAKFGLSAFDFRTRTTLLETGGFVELFGWQGNWGHDAYTTGGSTRRLWGPFDFELETSDDEDGGVSAEVRLGEPITIDVPLSSVEVGDTFYVLATAEADTVNHRQRESYLSAYLRDPQASDGMSLRFEGLEPLETPTELPALAAPAPAPACAAGPDPEAGTIELAADAFADPELPGDGATVVVTRAGGSAGAVSAHLATGDGSARAGADYTAVDTEVLFADGEEGSRAVRIPIATDAEAEPDETLTVTLSAPGGCAALGATTSA
ncbi:MAG TPA: Calx-beta domain-containing protein, partial [Kofleriaceae bacterium]|nr:Calx-beta domain-containing protein [Kofleriaceae bacterium]